MAIGTIVDSDSHIFEPADLWKKHLPSTYKNRELCIQQDDEGFDYISIDGKKSAFFSGPKWTTTLAGIGKSQKWMKDHADLPYSELGALIPGAVDPDERVKALDKEGINATFIYPSLGLGWQWECEDSELSAVYCQVYNEWLSDWCNTHPNRLLGIAAISVRNVNEGVEELNRAAKLGLKGAFVYPAAPGNIGYGNPYYDPLWTAAQELNMPISFHFAFNPNYHGVHMYPNNDAPEFYTELMLHGDYLIGFTNMMCEGVFEKFPGLKINMVEDGSGWIIHWLDKMDIKYEMYGHDMPLTMKPTDYFKRQVWLSVEPNETSVPAMCEILGPDHLIWGSDWPHYEGHTDSLNKMKKNVSTLTEQTQRKILGLNALTMYGLI